MLLQCRRHVVVLVVDGRIEAQFLDQIAALVGAAGDADHARALDPGNLPDHRANRTGSSGHQHRLALLGLAHFQQAKIGGQARHAQRAEEGRQRRQARIDLVQGMAVGDRILLHAQQAADEIADRELRVLRLSHLAERDGAHHAAYGYRRHVGILAGVHPAAHGRVQRNVADLDLHFAVAQRPQRFADVVEIAALDGAFGTAGKAELVVGDGHGGFLEK